MKLDRLLHPDEDPERSNDLPDILGITEDEVNEVWGYWLLFRATGKRIDFSNAAYTIPGWIITGILELEGIYGKLEEQDLKRKAGTNANK